MTAEPTSSEKKLLGDTEISHEERIRRATDRAVYPCQKNSYLMWVVCGASLDSPCLIKSEVWEFIRHAEKCESCQRWIVNELRFDNLSQFKNCMLWIWAGKPNHWRPRP
jgi:hypothetical protein